MADVGETPKSGTKAPLAPVFLDLFVQLNM